MFTKDIMKRAVVLSSHNPGLALIRGLGIMRVPLTVLYYDNQDMGYVSRYVDESYLVPNPDYEEKQFIDFICNKLRNHDGAILFPADDATLGAVSRNKGVLEKAGYHVVATEWSVTEKFINKIYSYQIAEQVGVPVPRTALIKSRDDIEPATKDMEFPFLVKPCVSHLYFDHFKCKMVKVEEEKQLYAECERALDLELDLMLQEYIPGDDTLGVNYNSFLWDGKIISEHTASKVRLSPKNFGVPSVVVSRKIPELREPSLRILEALGFYGYSCTEFKKDPRDGQYKFMEVNGRYNRSGLHPIACGINFPWIMYCSFISDELPEYVQSDKEIYWIDGTRDIFTLTTDLYKQNYGALNFLRPYFKPHKFAVFDWKDKKPFIKRTAGIFRKILIALKNLF